MTIVLNCWELEDSKGAAVSSLTILKPVAGQIPQWKGTPGGLLPEWKRSRQWNRRLPSGYYGPSWISGIAWKSEAAWAWNKFYGEYPKSPEPGDLLIILVGNGNATDDNQWDDTYKPTGFTFITEAGNNVQQCHCAAFYKVVDGTEGTTFSIPALNSDYMWAFCILISADGPMFIHKTGAESVVVNAVLATPLSIDQVTTSIPKCLGLFVAAFDGGDDGGFVCDGTGWLEQAENRSGTAAASAGGVFGKKTLTLAGATGAATVYAASGDGMVGFQFAIGEKAVFLATADDQWLNTSDDFWYGINVAVIALTARIKGLVYKIPRPIYSIPSTVRVPRVKLRATKLPALSAFNMYLKSKFAGIKTRQGKPKAILTRVMGITAKFAGTKLGATRVLRSVHVIPAIAKFAGVKLRATKLPPLWASIPAVVKFAGVKIRSTVPPVTAVLLNIVTVINARIKLVSKRGPLILFISMKAKRAGTKIRASKLTKWWRVFTVTSKLAGVKLGAQKDKLTLRIAQAVKRAGIKIGARKSALSLRISMKVKRAGVKMRSLKDRLILRQKAFVRTAGTKLRATRSAISGVVSLVTKVARVKIGGTVSSISYPVAIVVKVARVKLRATRSAVSFYLDFFRDTLDDFWVSTWDDEWLGHFILRIKNARLKLVSRKNKPFIAIPVTLKRAGVKLRARRSIVGAYYAALELAVKNARVKLRARKSTLSAYMATLALTVKNARTKLRAQKSVIDFHFLWLITKNARVKFQIERFTGWYINIPLKAARLKILARKTQFSFRLAIKNARVKLRARRVVLIRRFTLTVKRAGVKLRARKDALTLRLVMKVRRAGVKLRANRDILTRVVRIALKNARLKLRATKGILTFSLATVTLILKNVGVKMRPTLSIVVLYEATISLVLKNAGTKIRSGVSALRFSWMTPLTVKRAGVKIRAIPTNVRTRFFTLTVKAARLRIGVPKGQIVRVVTITAKTVGVKTGAFVSHLTTAFITLTVKATGIKMNATRSIASSIHTLGTKIARFKVGATKRTLSSGTILWRGLIKFVTRALSYRFSSSGDAVKFETRAEVYRFVSKND